jgi:hypothetical protein
MPPEEQGFTQDEAEAILRIASRRQHSEAIEGAQLDAMGRTLLEQTASELGISSQVLAEAETEYALQRADEEIRNEELRLRELFHRWRKAALLRDVIAYGLLNLICVIFFFTVTPFMFFWPAVVLLCSMLRLGPALTGYLSKRGDEKQYQTWSVQHWGAAMYATDYWRHRAGGRDPALSPNPNTDIHVYTELRKADLEFMRKVADSGVATKIEAMRRFREATGVGLGTAKQIVQEYELRNPGTFK